MQGDPCGSPDSLDWLRSSLLLSAVLAGSLGVSEAFESLRDTSWTDSSGASLLLLPKEMGPVRTGPALNGLSLRSRPELPRLRNSQKNKNRHLQISKCKSGFLQFVTNETIFSFKNELKCLLFNLYNVLYVYLNIF